MSFGRENVGKFTIANVSYFSEPGIWLGKILANYICFTKLAQVFPYQNFALYGKLSMFVRSERKYFFLYENLLIVMMHVTKFLSQYV